MAGRVHRTAGLEFLFRFRIWFIGRWAPRPSGKAPEKAFVRELTYGCYEKQNPPLSKLSQNSLFKSFLQNTKSQIKLEFYKISKPSANPIRPQVLTPASQLFQFPTVFQLLHYRSYNKNSQIPTKNDGNSTTCRRPLFVRKQMHSNLIFGIKRST